jgi:hypothetical protein
MELTMSRYICVAGANSVAHTTLSAASESRTSLLGAFPACGSRNNVGAAGILLRDFGIGFCSPLALSATERIWVYPTESSVHFVKIRFGRS